MPYSVGHSVVYKIGEKREAFPVRTLAPGQTQDYDKLKAEFKAKGERFIDPEFDPDTQDIVGTKKDGDCPFGYGVKSWKRPRDVNPESVFSKQDGSGKKCTRGDVEQGALGDCYFLSALDVVTTNEKLIDFIVPEDNNDDQECGIFHFRFWIKGYYFDVVVDDRLPYCNEKDLSGTMIVANEFWPPLIEKAYAKVYGSYALIVGGLVNDALEDFTGGVIKTFHYSSQVPKWEEFSLGNSGALIGLGSIRIPEEAEKRGLIPGHAYAVIGKEVLTDNSGKEIRLFRVLNPHAETEWNGDWSDVPTPSPKWDTVSAADRARLLTCKDEGEFWISYEDATNPKNFVKALLCYWLNDLDEPIPDWSTAEWKWIDLHGRFKGLEGKELASYEDVANRPQYLLEIESDAKENEFTVITVLDMEHDKTKKNEPPRTRFNVYEVKDEGILKDFPFPKEHFSQGKLRGVGGPWMGKSYSSREYCDGIALKKGRYVITPHLTDEKLSANFLLRIITQGKLINQSQ